jgi:hypothetical protein
MEVQCPETALSDKTPRSDERNNGMDNEGKSLERGVAETRGYGLFLDGYTAERLDRETVIVRSLDGTSYRVNALFQTCTCQATASLAEDRPCEHLLGYAELLCVQQGYDDALVAAYEAQYDAWGMTLESDRTERLLREMGVCEF